MSSQAIQLSVPSIKDGEAQPADITQLLFGRALSSRRSARSLACRDRSCCFRWCGRQLSLRNMPISGVDPTPRPAAVYASNAALPHRPQDSLPSCSLGFGRTRLALASSHQLLLSHPASGFPTGFSPRHTAARRVRCVLRKQRAMADAPSNTDRRPSSPQGTASSEASGYAGVFQAHRQSPILGSVQSAPEARALSSARITRPQRSYGPLRLPSDPPPVRRWGCQPQSRRVSPDDPHHPSNVPCPVPRRIEAGACVDCFPAHTAFPVSQAGRHPPLHVRGLLRLHARYGPLDCSTAQGGLCHEAPAQSVARPNRSSATGAIDNSPGGTLLHW